MRVDVTHVTRLEYDADVYESVMDVRLGPRTDSEQRWERFDLRAQPAAAIRRYTDGFGNIAHLLSVAKPHRELVVTSHGEVETLLADPFAPPRGRPAPLTPGERSDYLDPSPLIPADPGFAKVAEAHAVMARSDAFGAAQRLMEWVNKEFTYLPDVTDVCTTAATLLETRTGVCQDLAHVLIGSCRAAGIPARYVSGYIVSGGGGAAPGRGGGASHAWVECWSETHGWRGLDPTNALLASEHHVKMAIGRDYRDVSPTRGTFRGLARETLSVKVTARPVAA